MKNFIQNSLIIVLAPLTSIFLSTVILLRNEAVEAQDEKLYSYISPMVLR